MAAHDSTELAARTRQVVARLNRRVSREAGTTPHSQRLALATVLQLEPIPLSALATAECVSRPTMSGIVDQLVRKQLVRRRSDPQDLRVVLVETTAKGRRVLESSRAQATAYLREAFTQLTTAERATVAEAIEILDAMLESEAP